MQRNKTIFILIYNTSLINFVVQHEDIATYEGSIRFLDSMMMERKRNKISLHSAHYFTYVSRFNDAPSISLQVTVILMKLVKPELPVQRSLKGWCYLNIV